MVPMSAGAARGEYRPNAELYLLPTDERFMGGAAGLWPLLQSRNRLTFTELRLTFSDEDTEEYNLLLGHRLLDAGGTILGAYIAVDRRESAHNNTFDQVGVGIELLSPLWDFRANYYDPIDDEETIGPTGTGGVFQGNKLFTDFNVEEPLDGFDAEVGRLLSFLPVETRLYLGGYRFTSEFADENAHGFRVRTEIRPLKNVVLGVSYEDDELFDDELMLELRYQFGVKAQPGVRTQRERMTDFVRRDIDVRVTDAQKNALFHDNVIHFDNENDGEGGDAADNGDGSFENPYNRFLACTDKCDVEGALMYVHEGDGTTVGYDVPVELLNGQALFGQGYNLFGIGGDAFPQLAATGPVVSLADNNEVAGLEIEANSPAIYGYNVTGFDIHHNRLMRGGIYLYNVNHTSTGVIANNYIVNEGASGQGIVLRNTAYGGETSRQTVRLIDNVAYGKYGGLVAHNFAGEGAGSEATQTLRLAGLNIFAGGDNGGFKYGGAMLRNEAGSDSQAQQTMTLSGQSLFLGLGQDAAGLSASNLAFGSDGVATQSIKGRGLVAAANIYDLFEGDGGYGFDPGSLSPGNGTGLGLYNFADSANRATQTFDVRGAGLDLAAAGAALEDIPIDDDSVVNEIGDMVYGARGALLTGTKYGLGAFNYGFGTDAQTTQTVRLRGIEAIAGARGGVYLGNFASGDAHSEQTVRLTDIHYGIFGLGEGEGYGVADGVVIRNGDFSGIDTAVQDVVIAGAGGGGDADGLLIEGTRHGLVIDNEARDGHAEQDVRIRNLGSVTGLDGDGVVVMNEDIAYGSVIESAIQNVQLSGDDFSITGKYFGLLARNEAFGGGHAEQTLRLNGVGGIHGEYAAVLLFNADYANGGGPVVDAVYSGETAIQSVTLEGNDFGIYGGDAGIIALNSSKYGTAEQSLTLDGVSRVGSPDGDGIFLINAGKYGTAGQSVDILGRDLMIEAGGGYGVLAVNAGKYGAADAQQEVRLNGIASIAAPDGDGVFLSNGADGEYGTVAEQTFDLRGEGLQINAYDSGIGAVNESYGDATATQNVDVHGLASIDRAGEGYGGIGIGLYNRAAESPETAIQNVVIRGDAFAIRGFNAGVAVRNEAYNGGVAEQDVDIRDIGVIEAGEIGIRLLNSAGPSAEATQGADIRGGDISAASGVTVENEADYAGSGTQNVELRDMTIDGVSGYGLSIYNESSEGGAATQSVDLSGGGNTVQNSGAAYDVFIYNAGAGASQEVDLTGDNTIDSEGVYANGVGDQTVNGP